MNSKLYSVNELSEMFDISKQAIYKKKKNDPSLKPFWTTVNNVLHLDQRGLDVLKARVNLSENYKNNFNKVESDDNKLDNDVNLELLIGSYKEHINDLREQLGSKDDQISNLNETINTQSDLLKNMQILLKENKDQIKELKEGKNNIFKKWFKKKST